MTPELFIQLLEQLHNSDWQSVFEGQAVLMIDDLHLGIGPADAANAIISTASQRNSNANALKYASIANADGLLNNYYLTHPLTVTGFNNQASQLIATHGAPAFAALDGALPKFTLSVDGGEVIAESADSPRHRYGVFCKLESMLSEHAIEAQVRQWLGRGEAYEDYLGMNVCRYNC